MKVFVMRMGDGLALPVPTHLADLLGLHPGSELELLGPAPDGTIRYVPAPTRRRASASREDAPDEARPSPPEATPSPPPAPGASPPLDLPTPTDVVRALAPKPRERPPPPPLEQEIDVLVGRYAATLREVDR